jgi:hypothetical protein
LGKEALMFKLNDNVIVGPRGAVLHQMSASSDWSIGNHKTIPEKTQGRIRGFPSFVVGEPRYIFVDFCGDVGYVLESSIVKQEDT